MVAGSSGRVQSSTYIALASSVHLRVAYTMVAPTPFRLQVSLGNGQAMLDQEVTACATGLRALPVTAILGMSAMVLPKSGPGAPPVPRTLAIDCTGLGGHDLGGPPFDICIRTDKHGQSIYGPSVAPIESQRYENQNCIQVVALGATKAMHEFLVLHYLATDSAQGWENFLSQCIPNGNWMPTTSRRAMLMNMFDKCHIAPSYRRMPHQSWATSMTLLVDLLRGNGKHRYLRTVTANKVPVQVCIRGFSAGSYSGLSMCHLLWRMQHVSVRGTLGGTSLPPVLLSRIPGMQGERLLLYHYTNDALCQWKPGPDTLKALACRYCIVSNDAAELRGHFGSAEHSPPRG